jgi:hypothetical protein
MKDTLILNATWNEKKELQDDQSVSKLYFIHITDF